LNPVYADIVLPLPLDRAYTYRVPPALAPSARVGMRAVVPLRSRMETGFIVALHPASELEKVKEILALPDEGPVFSPAMLSLCRWMSEYYCCSWGEALQTAVPGGLRVNSRLLYRLNEHELTSGRFSEMQRAVVAALFKDGARTEAQLAKVLGRKGLTGALQGLVRRGIVRADAELKQAGVSIRTETWVILREENIPPPDDLVALQRRAPKQAAVYFDLLHNEGARPATGLYTRHGVNKTVLHHLAKRGLVVLEEREFYRAPAFAADERSAEKHALNPDQDRAVSAMKGALAEGRFQTYLLRGITGSGKTEVYLQAIEEALALGKDALLLVPEISLTPQTVGRFVARFRESIAVLHSGLSTGERYDEWRRAHRGEVRIVVGARSAIFAPLPNPGIIIVDEEHDSSYKQGESPRYHARDVAIMRAKMEQAVCVLGSATPSLESFHNVQRGKSELLELKERATTGRLPTVKLVDLRTEAKEAGGKIILSRVLEAAVNRRIAAKEQVILLLNRRGFAPYVLCPQCGWVAMCPNCQVSFTYHASGAKLRCHYCNAERPKPEICDECHFNPLIYLGTGTQKAEDFLLRSFPGARVERMDADSTAGKGGHAKILGRFAAGEIDILIGTQMLAKGHDYPGVTLVGVINGDTGLAVPDFRAAEQTFQLLTQVAGRAGRGGKPGEVYIQTFRPKHYALQAACEHDYEGFCTQELGYREEAGYPPFRRMANFLLDGEEPERVEKAAVVIGRIVRELAREEGYRGIEIIGPSQAPLARINKRYRWHLAALSRSTVKLNRFVRAVREAFDTRNQSGKVALKVDLDPQGIS